MPIQRRPFETLTPRGRVQRLRALAGTHLGAWGLAGAPLNRLHGGFNTTFMATTPEGSPVVLRVHRPGWRTSAMIDGELRWLERLATEGDIIAPRPLRTTDGHTHVAATSPGVPGPRVLSALGFVPGRVLARDLTPARTRDLGALLARLHVSTAAWPPPGDRAFLRFDHPYAALSRRWPDLPDDLLPPERRAVFLDAEAVILAGFERLRSAGPLRLCHLDLHPHNVVITASGALAPIDFDDCALAPPALDIGISLHYLRALDATRPPEAHLADLLAGYATVATPPCDAETALTLAAARQLILVNHLCHETDPALAELLPTYLATAEARLRALTDASPRTPRDLMSP
jgi:Ser/Thr protein kinase RdoA (MazF antagonist)